MLTISKSNQAIMWHCFIIFIVTLSRTCGENLVADIDNGSNQVKNTLTDNALLDDLKMNAEDSKRLVKVLADDISRIIVKKLYDQAKLESNNQIENDERNNEITSLKRGVVLPPFPKPPGLWGGRDTSSMRGLRTTNFKRKLAALDSNKSPLGLWGRSVENVSPPGLWGDNKSPPGLWGRDVDNLSPPGLWGDSKTPKGAWGREVENKAPKGLWGREDENYAPPGIWGDELERRAGPPGIWGRRDEIKLPPGVWGREVENKSPPGLWGREVENKRPPGVWRQDSDYLFKENKINSPPGIWGDSNIETKINSPPGIWGDSNIETKNNSPPGIWGDSNIESKINSPPGIWGDSNIESKIKQEDNKKKSKVYRFSWNKSDEDNKLIDNLYDDVSDRKKKSNDRKTL